MTDNVMAFMKKATEDPQTKDRMLQMAMDNVFSTDMIKNYSGEISSMAKKFGINLDKKEIDFILNKLEKGNFEITDLASVFGLDLGGILGNLGGLLSGFKK